LCIQFHLSHEPGFLKAQDLVIEIGLLHRLSSLQRILPDPQKCRMDQIFSPCAKPAGSTLSSDLAIYHPSGFYFMWQLL
jgi:hypothetical protein